MFIDLSTAVPGEPELQLYSVTPDSVSFSWSLPPGSIVDYFTVKWEIVSRNSPFATFCDKVSSESSSYTLTGFQDYNDATYTITVTAFNGVGNSSSSKMKVRGNVDTACGASSPVGTTSNSNDADEALIAGVVVAGLVILIIATVVLGLLVYYRKLKLKQKQNL